MNGKYQKIAEQTKDEILDFLLDSYRAVESAIAYTRHQFEKDGEDIETFQFVHTVRYKTKLFLKKKQYDVKDLQLNGLHVTYNGYEIKLLKDCAGLIPPARHSKARLDFYNQLRRREHPNLLDVLFPKEETEELSPNLIVLYKVNRVGELSGMELICTSDAKTAHDSPTALWLIDIPHPATSILQQTSYDAPSKDVSIFDDFEDDSDLDIFKDGTDN